MKTVELLQRMVLSNEAATPDEMGYSLNIAGVYQDGVTQDWATQTCHLATQQARAGRVQNSWFNINSLGDPKILADAVSAALTADVIVVSVYAAGELPLDLYVWFDLWLPRRPARGGALAALVGIADPLDSRPARTFEYLHAMARKGQLDFIPQERRCPVTSSAFPPGLFAESASAAAQARQKLYGPRYDAYYHRGLNEPMNTLVASETCGLVPAGTPSPKARSSNTAAAIFKFSTAAWAWAGGAGRIDRRTRTTTVPKTIF
jgi:hypothetical protein